MLMIDMEIERVNEDDPCVGSSDGNEDEVNVGSFGLCEERRIRMSDRVTTKQSVSTGSTRVARKRTKRVNDRSGCNEDRQRRRVKTDPAATRIELFK